ncbi:hypothetical protein LOC51_08635 [Rubrivivax sp. JA1024]|nr:hypothetical protein [Rubrivivax sp. JA1024]
MTGDLPLIGATIEQFAMMVAALEYDQYREARRYNQLLRSMGDEELRLAIQRMPGLVDTPEVHRRKAKLSEAARFMTWHQKAGELLRSCRWRVTGIPEGRCDRIDIDEGLLSRAGWGRSLYHFENSIVIAAGRTFDGVRIFQREEARSTPPCRAKNHPKKSLKGDPDWQLKNRQRQAAIAGDARLQQWALEQITIAIYDAIAASYDNRSNFAKQNRSINSFIDEFVENVHPVTYECWMPGDPIPESGRLPGGHIPGATNQAVANGAKRAITQWVRANPKSRSDWDLSSKRYNTKANAETIRDNELNEKIKSGLIWRQP